MYRKILIPYSIGDYNKILEDFQIKKIKCMEKDELIVCLKNPESWIYDFYLKENCINLFQRTGGFTPIGLSDDDLFRIGIDTTIKQLNKRYFFELCDDNLLILKKVKSRIVNNIRNYFSPTRKVNYQQFQNSIFQTENYYEIFEEIIFELDLKKIDQEKLKLGLKNVWEDVVGDMDFDMQDFQDLCGKFEFNPLDVLIYDPYMLPSMSKEACNNGDYQLVLVFEEEIA